MSRTISKGDFVIVPENTPHWFSKIDGTLVLMSLHVPRTSVREQAEILLARLRSLHRATFRQLIADCAGTYEVVARFLAVLELYRDGQISLDQAAPLGDLIVTWTDHGGAHHLDVEEYDG